LPPFFKRIHFDDRYQQALADWQTYSETQTGELSNLQATLTQYVDAYNAVSAELAQLQAAAGDGGAQVSIRSISFADIFLYLNFSQVFSLFNLKNLKILKISKILRAVRSHISKLVADRSSVLLVNYCQN
jgi:hypothetical protein